MVGFLTLSCDRHFATSNGFELTEGRIFVKNIIRSGDYKLKCLLGAVLKLDLDALNKVSGKE